MLTSPIMSRPGIALPSIREMFPDMDGSSERSTLQPTARLSPQQSTRSPAMRSATDAATMRNADKYHAHSRYATSPYPQYRGSLPSPPPSRSGEAQMHTHSSSPEILHRGPVTTSPAYSFNVLRADPAGSSLEHVASSTSARNHPRATNLAPVAQPTHSMAHTSGIAPVFRVSMPIDMSTARRYHYHEPAPTNAPMTGQVTFREGGEPSSSKHHYSAAPPTHGQAQMMAVHQQHPYPSQGPPSGSAGASASSSIPPGSMLAFSISDPPGRAPTIVDGSRRGFPKIIEQGHAGQHSGNGGGNEGRGKRHECPHCRKRFNRPSSLKIHVNTHTGARPYRCPYPGCGREFNVNSNMRRHWRNHSRVGAGPFPEELDVFVQTHRPDPRSAGQFASINSASAGMVATSHRRAASGASSRAALISPPTTTHSISDGDSDDEPVLLGSGPGPGSVPSRRPYGAMDVDDADPSDGESASEDEDEDERPRKIQVVPSSSSSESEWSRPASPCRQPASSTSQTTYYTHGSHHSRNGHSGDYTYRPSLPAYARSMTDTRVSTALRPAFAT
ncbi:hypothetical protein CONPUDRAFT_136509 [Coniophora puteana RWD-64-598 SS2]|uniref:C2H2-type domain-containing protein n=1 Tax=Coniophora puteana (strain RWD-64-598) TaxID=741705 RepID=A0A5M3MRF2_CONPW|nr:uncharacterized protein CONPUDRAFT_136509 [Coniophora puteana RWD-64-598 SS2]EIW81666.1 hypothetical protein CONPUDRAFT_136509 [Coniophora puteana RWD-64-598 SS2]